MLLPRVPSIPLRPPAVSILLALGFLALLTSASRPAAAQASVAEPRLRDVSLDARLRLEDSRRATTASRSRALGTAGFVTDTIWIGYTPGHQTADNYWSIYAGSGPGFRRLPGQGGMWDFDTPVNGDSLQGWWPLRGLYATTGGLTLKDWQRPWWAPDIGNTSNYVINQGAGAKRSFGVVGVWHRDNGVNGTARCAKPEGCGIYDLPEPSWTPLQGQYSAWMGLRVSGDTLFTDPVTGNAFNEDVLQYNSGGTLSGATYSHFPGYGAQMDQMLYRDLLVDTTATLTISFQYRTNMSTGYGSSSSTRTGWFDKDPLSATDYGGAVNLQPGNFISSSDAGTNAPRDSFMVYVGAPVESSFVGSDGETREVFDPLRRWFSEVLRTCGEPHYQEILSVAGNVSPATRAVTLPATTVKALAAGGGRLRLVFRVKTNRGYDDQSNASSTYSSNGAGAAVVDNVTYQVGSGATVTLGDFEAANSIDNGDGDPLASWKSTGKPPGLLFHAHDLATLTYDDVCGPVGSAGRACNMTGGVLSAGDHDYGEAAGGLDEGKEDRERLDYVASPAICLMTNPSFPDSSNAIGLTGNDLDDSDGELYVAYDFYPGVLDAFKHGNTWTVAVQSYPMKAGDGHSCWGAIKSIPFTLLSEDGACLTDIFGLRGMGVIETSNSNGIPDSIRIFLAKRQACFYYHSLGPPYPACSSTDGAYFDNVSLGVIRYAPSAAWANIWDWYADAFPANEWSGTLAALDTMAARVKTGLNTAPNTGDLLRMDVPGDTSIVSTVPDAQRVDLVFRILPGPGNYRVVGHPGLPAAGHDLRGNNPSDATELNQSDPHQFWASYLADNGEFGTPGGHPAAPGGGKTWDPNVWNSARCDTAQWNLFPLEAAGIVDGSYPGEWMSTYHEGDPRGSAAQLGIPRHKCFPAMATYPGYLATDCEHDPPAGGSGYDLSWVSPTGGPYAPTGYDGNAWTTEGTKIIPDGLLTPGAHVEYFYRVQTEQGVALLPDTGTVYPQPGEVSYDAHRWQEFGVLPDRWKDPAYQHPVTGQFGMGAACMLVVDLDDRRGDETVWVSVADSIGATDPSRFGAHNGWHARGGQDVNDSTCFVAAHLGQAGTTWDFFQVRAAESSTTTAGSLGSRYAAPAQDPAMAGKESRQGPTYAMMNLYKVVLLLTGDLNSGILGPYQNRSTDDIGVLETWLSAGSTASPDRALWVMGDGFAEDCVSWGAGSPQSGFLGGYLGADLLNGAYRAYSGNQSLSVALEPATGFEPQDRIRGVSDRCFWMSDVLAESSVPEAIDAHYYHGDAGGPLLAGVYKPHSNERPWISLVDGFDLKHLTSAGGNSTAGRIEYFYDVFTEKLGDLCTITGDLLLPSTGVDDTTRTLADFVRFAANPARRGRATLVLGLARRQEVEARLYDVAGRVVRTLVRKELPAGEHHITWDGRDQAGEPVHAGVYFARVQYRASGYRSARKLILLQ